MKSALNSTGEITVRPIMRTKKVAGLKLVGLVALATLAGCANVSKRHFTVGTPSDDYRARHPIIISEKEKTMDIPVAAGSYGLPKLESSAIVGFLDQFKRSASKSINVLVPSGSENEGAAKKAAKQIVGTIRKSGISRNRIVLTPYQAGSYGSSAPIRLSYLAIQAGVDGCGQWPADLAAGSENRNYQNFGCASQKNLAAIVANPSDLLGPRGPTSIDAERRLKVIEAYRNAQNPATVYTVE